MIAALLLAALVQSQPEVVQPGVISVKGRHETFPAIDPEDGSLWFSVYTDNWDRQTIMRAPKSGDGWGPAVAVSFSGQSGDRAPRFSPDGRRLYFTSNRPVEGHPAGDMNIWVVERSGTGWGEPQMVPAPVSGPNGREVHSAVTSDGTLFFASNRPGGAGHLDIWRWKPGGQAENLGAPINDNKTQPDLWVSSDGRWMILVITGHPDGPGEDDFFVSEFRNGTWSAPAVIKTTGVNSAEYEYGPSISPDGRWLLFTSHRSAGDADIYRVEVKTLNLPK